ncbi:deoxyribose-phosphate aldolase [Pseudoflavonifractor sp. 524-17]|uniref:deoxyribose-phosphate aldolase n=1 Tax=Pseudoflavonifractor sp. 524-17 TaxID=2304577 RepID=UPI001379932E|nr:deoxyribose-phosphate aldolase [Pseudoflavonifractor sp. 524-17]NCE64920.1 deoxyribose-phosphate aldolase [Pseudoflavonifractor sp. 524-17]
MDIANILSRCDHTLLKQDATWEQIKTICDDGMAFHCASVCIPASYVKQASNYVGNELKICTVIGFPNGYSTTTVKVFETEDAIRSGADEIDMVINLGWVKDQRWDDVLEEIKTIKASCKGRILKVIVETCLLTEAEKIKMCELVTKAGAEYIKTSTGFSTGGATAADVALFKAHVGPDVKIKAAGGIHSFEEAQAMLDAGADRLGASALVKLAKN